MSRDVMGKLAAGEKLDEDDVQYAADRGIPLPEEYDVPDTETQHEGARPPEPVHSGGDMPSAAGEEGDLNDMTKAELRELAEERGIEITKGMSKDELVEALS